MNHVLLGVFCLIVILILIVAVTRHRTGTSAQNVMEISEESIEANTPDYEVDLLTVNEYSRPGIALNEVNGIVIHYTANPGTSAEANRDYFEGLKDSHTTKASAHFVVGLEGEIIQCIPTSEIAYASNDRNSDTLSIECCYENEDGSFNQETYDSVIHLTAWLCAKFGLTSDDVMRHYDITGKMCPIYYVENPDAWEQFRADVDAYLESM
ncbi:MAG: peptidoglycan recognition protein family protein [Clostridiales bacterium]|nr:peptidoglycan recognition protein family protein [Clostridiales bacterium]